MVTGWGELLDAQDVRDPFGVRRATRKLPEASRPQFTAEWQRLVEASDFDVARAYHALFHQALAHTAAGRSDDALAEAWSDVFATTSRYVAGHQLGREIEAWLADAERSSAD